MSGGQQQRVALARALVNHPTVLLLDEPLGALDLKLRKEMQLELKALQREVGITFVYVTHDQEEALTMSDVIVVMQRRPDPAAGRPDRAVRAAGQPVRGRLHRDVELHRRRPSSGVDPTTRRRTVESDDGPRAARRGHRPDGRRRRAGDGVTVAIRPERLESSRPDGAPAATAGRLDAAIRGRINQGTYLGDQTEYRIEHRAGGRADRPPPERTGAGRRPGAGPGDPVVVRWHEEANLVLAG